MMHATNNPSETLTADALRGEVSAWLPRLGRLLDEQCTLCAELDALSVKQTDAVRAGDTDALLRVLGLRQPIVDRVSAINGALEPFRAQKDGLLGRLAPAQRDGIVQKVGRIAALVENVRARDDADRAALEKQRSVVADELVGLTRGKGAATAYASAAAAGRSSTMFQDRKG